jgi:hypothetical protein
LTDDSQLVEGKFALAPFSVDARQLEMGLHVGRVPLQSSQTEPKRSLQIASLSVRRRQLDERRRLRVRRDFGAQFLQ